MPKLKEDNQEHVKITSWDYKSPMNAKLVLGDQWKSDRHYRFVRKDNVDKFRDLHGYTQSGKEFKGMVLMETSKEHHGDLRAENQARIKLRSRTLDDNMRREVHRVTQGKVGFSDEEN